MSFIKVVSIFISIASYRDPDLINTVQDCWNKAKFKDKLYFSIVSQAEDSEHPDLSFIPSDQIRYVKKHWKESKGACWAREIASRDVKTDYFLQIDSHSRFVENWDETALYTYTVCQSFWGNRIVMSNYPYPFEIDWISGEAKLSAWTKESHGYEEFKLRAEWDEPSRMVVARWEPCEPKEGGHEIFFVSANSLFCDAAYIREVPYDSDLYFTGEEPSLAIRFYTRGIKIINTPSNYMYTNYNRDNGKRPLHWGDHPEEYGKLNQSSYKRLSLIMTGDTSLGIYGIGSEELFKEYQERSGVYLEDKKERIAL